MKTIAVFAALALAGCAGGWYKPGASEQEFYQSRSQCDMRSAQAYPVMMTTTGGYQAPPQTRCTSQPTGFGTVQTNCSTTQGPSMPGYQSDQNAVPRLLAFQDCMRGQGWSWRTQ